MVTRSKVKKSNRYSVAKKNGLAEQQPPEAVVISKVKRIQGTIEDVHR